MMSAEEERDHARNALCDLIGCEYRDTPLPALIDVVKIMIRMKDAEIDRLAALASNPREK